MDNNQRANGIELLVRRTFDAPREMVFGAFASAPALAEWWGPPGNPITVEKFSFQPGGLFLYKAEMQGNTAWGKFVFGQIRKPELLEFVSSFSNEKGETIRAPFSELFPLEIFNRLEFEEEGGKTTIALSGYPINATKEEMAFFDSMKGAMQQGFNGTLDQLSRYLSARLKGQQL